MLNDKRTNKTFEKYLQPLKRGLIFLYQYHFQRTENDIKKTKNIKKHLALIKLYHIIYKRGLHEGELMI